MVRFPRVTAVGANNGARWTVQAEQRIAHAAREFGEQVEWRHIGAEELLALLQARKPIDADLKLIGAATVESFDFRRVLTGRMSVAELARLTDRYDNRLFERNIRRYLGLAGNRVNEAVAQTLRASDQRSNFYFYNNGITITCSQFRHNALQKEDLSVQVSDLQIVNGGQTARTVQHVAKDIGPQIGDAEVLVRPVRARTERRRAGGSDHVRHEQPESGRPAGPQGERCAPEGSRPLDLRVGVHLSRQARGPAAIVQRVHERGHRGSGACSLAPPAAPGAVQEPRALRCACTARSSPAT